MEHQGFSKECKKYFNLGKYQSTIFDGQIASLTITMITHTALTLEKRFSALSMGEMFRETQKHLLEFTLLERLNIIIIELINFLMDLCEIDIEELMERINNNEKYEKQYSVMLMALKTIKQENCAKRPV